MAAPREKPRPFLAPEYCKGCGRCIDACALHCIAEGSEINPSTGLTPVALNLERCTGCGLCFDACPEPYGLRPEPAGADFELVDPAALFGARTTTAPVPVDIPDRLIPIPRSEPLVVKGAYASAIGAILAGCRHFFGYPITPSTEGAELMAKLLPRLDGVFVQAVSEVAAINMMYGCGGAGLRAMTFTSSPGFSLMLEGLSYMVGSEVPGVVVNVMRGGPGLGNIGPEQSDISLACRALGHGNSHGIVLAPSTPQEMLDLTMLAFDLAFRYRNPVIVVADGYLGQMTGKVLLPPTMVEPGLPGWAVWGDEAHRGNLINSIILNEVDLELHNIDLNDKYAQMTAREQRAETFLAEDADVLIVACNTPARMAKGAVEVLRSRGVAAGLFRPISLWPFPVDRLLAPLSRASRVVVVEASNGQLEDEMRLALSKAGIRDYPEIESVRHFGGILPQMEEIIEKVQTRREVAV
jgi:pyruvate/2-oxoacid:ferredoxin oxidoreductase alpha subunit/NAD-dependent dihydropyrimidine dehydrogenase PreA subunit